MEVQVNMRFEQLVKIVKMLPKRRLNQLLAEIEREEATETPSHLEKLLLNGPVATKKQLETIANNRNSINQWQTI